MLGLVLNAACTTSLIFTATQGLAGQGAVGSPGVVLERRPQCALSHEVRRRGQ